jgi:nucleoside-diphosphate-sugar epimerase
MNLVRALCEAEADVAALVRRGKAPSRLAELDGQVELLDVDVAVPGEIEAAVERVRPDLAVGLVVEHAHPETSDERLRQLEVSVLGTARLVESLARSGCKRMVHLGSSLEYGPRSRPLREDDRLAPIVPRGAAKAAETLVCLTWARALGLSALVLRPFSVYGPWEDETRLVPAAIRAALECTELPLTEPGFAHDFVYVTDVVDAITLALGAPAELDGLIFNIGTGIQTTNEDLVAAVGRVVRRKIRVLPGMFQAHTHDCPSWVADNDRARQELGWKPTTGLEAGLRLTISWLDARARAGHGTA